MGLLLRLSFVAAALCATTSLPADDATLDCGAGAKAFGGGLPEVERGCLVGGKRHGPYQSYWPDGARWRDGSYEDGRRAGLWKGSWPGGKPAYEATYRGGLLDGSLTLYYPTGGKKLEGTYALGRPNGTFVAYREDGEKVGQLVFDSGKVRPKSIGNPEVAGFLPSGASSASVERVRKSLKPFLLKDAGNTLLTLGRAPKPAKLDGEKAERYAEQSAFLERLGQRVLAVLAALDVLEAESSEGLRAPARDELTALVELHRASIAGAIEASRTFERSSAAASARHAMAATAIRKLEPSP